MPFLFSCRKFLLCAANITSTTSGKHKKKKKTHCHGSAAHPHKYQSFYTCMCLYLPPLSQTGLCRTHPPANKIIVITPLSQLDQVTHLCLPPSFEDAAPKLLTLPLLLLWPPSCRWLSWSNAARFRPHASGTRMEGAEGVDWPCCRR